MPVGIDGGGDVLATCPDDAGFFAFTKVAQKVHNTSGMRNGGK